MNEAIIIPSPNWFQASVLRASEDGWLVYGGPSKSLCFLEPLNNIGTIDSKQRFRAHIFHKAHKEKIVSVDISPEWPEKRNVITAGHDGVVKEWSIEQKDDSWTINYLHCHEEHNVQKEEAVGVCYSLQRYAVSVGNFGQLCRWDLSTNVVRRFSTHLKNFKPTCISCSPHKQLHVAVGTRQGVIFVIDISGTAAKLIYKVRAQDDEVNRVVWCPQYSVNISKVVCNEKKHTPKGSFSASSRMERIRNDQEPSEVLELALEEKAEKEKQKEDEVEKENEVENEKEVIIPEDDMFDVYKDHDENEFGHKKYQPEDIIVKVKNEPEDDFLAECERLKAEILKKKNEPEESIESLVEALDKAHVEESVGDKPESEEKKELPHENQEYAHLLASIGKYGGVRIWTQTGKLLASCFVLLNRKEDKVKGSWPTLHWFKPDSLLIVDGKNQVLETNPLHFDSKNKLQWKIVHSLHRRGVFFISSSAPRVQTPEILSGPASDKWVVWTTAQDRNVISYDMKKREKIEVFNSCGAFLYEIQSCAYDAGKIAVSSGDGSIRIWETHTTNELEDQLSSGVITSYWQNVQGKIFTLAWHPTKENVLAFGTAESRVGILDGHGNSERPAKNFPNFFKQGVYSLSWGEGNNLYVCGNGELALFVGNRIDEPGKGITVEVEGQKWFICAVLWTTRGLLVGAINGGVALLDADYNVVCATFAFSKTIYTLAWHPQQTTNSEEESMYQNYIAICSVDKVHTIVILEYDDKDGDKQFKKIASLAGHQDVVLNIAWNPHRDAQLLSTSQDATVRIWNVLEGECIAIFGGHTMAAQGALWCPQPRLADKVLSCGADSCVRLWDIKDFPVDKFINLKRETTKGKRRKPKRAKPELKLENKAVADHIGDSTQNTHVEEAPQPSTTENVAINYESKRFGSTVFLLPNTGRQMSHKPMSAVKHLTKYIEQNNSINMQEMIKTYVPQEKSLRYLKMFGTMNDLNELLDLEANYHLEAKDYDAYLMLLFFRGKVDDMIQFACDHNRLDPYLLSLSPTVSFKYWKDTTQLYLAQLNKMAALGQDDFISNRYYGGIHYRRATALLSVHDIKGCVEVMLEAHLYKEAYILCRLRHMDSIAEEVLLKWAERNSGSGALFIGAILTLVRGDVSQAAITLGRSSMIPHLKLAALLANLAGHNTFAAHIEAKVLVKESEAVPDSDDELDELPSRAEAVMNKTDSEFSDSDSECENEKLIQDAKTVNGNGVSKEVSDRAQNKPVLNSNGSDLNGKVLRVDEANTEAQ